MSRSQFGPAAGASGGAAPRLADLRAPRFLRFDQAEIDRLLHHLRDPWCTHTYWLLAAHSDFKSGELLTTYARLIDLMTPPRPERGPRRAGPSMWIVRRAVADLVAIGLVRRGDQNEAQGQLRLFITPRDTNAAPVQPRKGISAPDGKARRVSRRVSEELEQAATRLRSPSLGGTAHQTPQGYQ